ncbi:hypothetical protein Pcinc_009393 [Petrolisthes cinctipes]|uniref:Uncharacterized protein n=1 Tax=Petrolisthes cinctipes TaxID=88211 RepID=A0AAE1G7H7_PETCI|nr:hypothetical protein Pcinc_009393 [Petrolisthes cinctipes]
MEDSGARVSHQESATVPSLTHLSTPSDSWPENVLTHVPSLSDSWSNILLTHLATSLDFFTFHNHHIHVTCPISSKHCHSGTVECHRTYPVLMLPGYHQILLLCSHQVSSHQERGVCDPYSVACQSDHQVVLISVGICCNEEKCKQLILQIPWIIEEPYRTSGITYKRCISDLSEWPKVGARKRRERQTLSARKRGREDAARETSLRLPTP